MNVIQIYCKHQYSHFFSYTAINQYNRAANGVCNLNSDQNYQN